MSTKNDITKTEIDILKWKKNEILELIETNIKIIEELEEEKEELKKEIIKSLETVLEMLFNSTEEVIGTDNRREVLEGYNIGVYCIGKSRIDYIKKGYPLKELDLNNSHFSEIFINNKSKCERILNKCNHNEEALEAFSEIIKEYDEEDDEYDEEDDEYDEE